MKIIKIICDEELPSVHLLNKTDFDIFTTTGKDDTFAMSRKETIKEPKTNVKEKT